MNNKLRSYAAIALFYTMTAIPMAIVFLYEKTIGSYIIFMKIYFRKILLKSPEKVRTRLSNIYAFDFHGLLHNQDYLSQVNLRDFILNNTLEELSYYVDEHTYRAIINSEHRFSSIFDQYEKEVKIEYILPNLNATGIGNLAFVCLHHPDEQVKTNTKNTLEQLKEHYAAFA